MECFVSLALIEILLHVQLAIRIVELVMIVATLHVFRAILLLNLYFLKISHSFKYLIIYKDAFLFVQKIPMKLTIVKVLHANDAMILIVKFVLMVVQMDAQPALAVFLLIKIL